MLFDTDVLIWVFRGNATAAEVVRRDSDRKVSIVTYMELLQGARDIREVRNIKAFLADLGFRVLPLTENIGHRASIYIEEYSLKSGLRMADALLAATAVENGAPLCTGNRKHYKAVTDLEVVHFKP